MAEPIVPVEGNEGFLDSATDFISGAIDSTEKAIGGAITDSAKFVEDKASSLFDSTKNTLENVADGKFSVFSPLFTEAERKQIQPKFQISQQDRDLGKEINDISGWQMAKDIYTGVKKITRDFTSGNISSGIAKGIDSITGFLPEGYGTTLSKTISQNLIPGLSEDKFNSNLKSIKDQLDIYNKSMNDIASSDPKFKGYRDFTDSVYNAYLKARGVTTIDNQDDFMTFQQAELAKLNPMEQQKITQQRAALNQELEGIRKSALEQEQKMRDYINQSIKATGDKTGEQVYQDIQNADAEAFKDNKFLNITQKIRDKATEDINAALSTDAKLLIGMGASWNNLKDSIIDDKTASDQYYYSLLAMNDLPGNEYAAMRFKETADVANKYRLDFARTLGMMSNAPEFKGLSEVEKREKIQKIAYDRLTPEEKQLWRSQEGIITGISRQREYMQMKSRAENMNPMAFLDGLSFIGSTIQSWVDKVYDSDKDEVPHYIKQETRDLLYSDEGNMKKLASMVLYNTDALVSTVATMKVMNLPIKGINKVVDTLAKSADKGLVMNGIKIGFTEGKLAIIPTAMKGLSESMISGAATDPIFDNLMVQAPNKTTEEFNQFTNVLFDATLFTGGKGVLRGIEGAKDIYQTTANSIMWKKLNGEDKLAVKQMTELFETKYNKKLTELQVTGILNEGDKIIRGMYNPVDIDAIFKKPGELYQFIKTNIDGMNANGIDEVLTGNGLGIRRNVFLGMSKSDFSDMTNLIKIKNMDAVSDFDIKRQAIALKEIRVKLDQISNYASGNGAYNGMTLRPEYTKKIFDFKLMKSQNNSTEYATDLANIQKQIRYITELKDNDITTEALENLNESVYSMQNKYGTSKMQSFITLVDAANSKSEFKIAIDDLRSFDGMEGKNFADLIREGKVTVKEGNKIPAKTYNIKNDTMSLSETYRRNFIKSIQKDIEKFASESKVNTGLSNAEFTYQLSASITNVIKGGIAEFGYIRNITDVNMVKEEMDRLSEFVHDKLKKFIGADYIGNKVSINEKIPSKNSNLISDIPSIIKYLNAQDSYFNLSYGHFYGNDADEAAKIPTGVLYISSGKKIHDDSLFTEKTSGISKGTHVIAKYVKSVGSIVTNAIGYGLKDGVLNFGEGLKKVGIVESAIVPSNLFKNGVLDRSEIDRIVLDALKGVKNPEYSLKEFIYNVFKDTKESQAQIVTPMIYNLTYKYYQYLPLIKELFTKFNIKENQIKYIDAFAEVILSPSLYTGIVDKTIKYTDGGVDIPALRQNAIAQWEEFAVKLEAQGEKIQTEIDKLRSFIKNTKDYRLKEEFDMAMKAEIKKKKKIENAIASARFKESFINEKSNVKIHEIMEKNLVSQTKNFAFASLIGENMDVGIHNISESIQNTLKMKNNIFNMSKEDREIVKGFLSDVKAAKTLEAQKEVIQRQFTGKMKDVTDVIKTTIFTKNNEFKIVDEDSIINMIKNLNTEVYDHDYILANNPIKKIFGAFLNNSNFGQDKKINESIMKHFNVPYTYTADELYHSGAKHKNISGKSFKDIVDNMNASTNADGTVKYGNLDEYRDFLKSIISESEYTVKTDRVDNAVDLLLNSKFEDGKRIYTGVLDDGDLIRQFKDISNRVRSDKDINLKLEEKTWENKGESGTYKVVEKQGLQYNERILQLDQMAKDMDVMFIRGIDGKAFGKLNAGGKSIKKLMEKHMDKIFGSGAERIQSAYVTDASIYAYLIKTINGTHTTESDFLKLAKYRRDIMDQLGIPEGYIMVGNFGDKDTAYTVYRNGLNIFGEKTNINIDKSFLVEDKDIYVGGFENKGKGTPEGDGKDKAMRKIADGFIGEIKTEEGTDDYIKSSSATSYYEITGKYSKTENGKTFVTEGETWDGGFLRDVPGVVMLARNGKFGGKNLMGVTKDRILEAHKLGHTFVVGDMVNVDTQFIDYLDEIGASYKIYHTGDKPRILKYKEKASNKIVSNIPLLDKGLIAQDIFEFEYALKNGYYNYTGGEKYSWEKFTADIRGKNFSSYKDFRKFVDENISGKILDTQVIRKRESANMSNYTTFDGYKHNVNTYIIEEIIPEVLWLKPFMEEGKVRELSMADIDTIIEQSNDDVRYYIDKLREDYGSKEDQFRAKTQSFLDLYLNKDLQDGTSFVSNDLGEIRAKIQGKREAARQFKDHFYGDTKDGRVLGKTLFNLGEIKMDGKKLDHTVVIGESSLKLKGGYKKYPKSKKITIDGKEYTVVGEVEGTDTSFFKNASSDSYKESADTTASDSIKAKLEYKYAKAIEDIQKKEITEAFERTIASLSDFNINVNSLASIEVMVGKMVSIAQAGAGTNSILGSRIKAFLSEVDTIVNKPTDKGQKVYIRESSHDITPEEIIMSRKSPLVKQLLEEVKDDIQAIKDNLDMSDADKELAIKNIEDNLYTVGYRYPVPSKYNLGLYKVRFAEDLPNWHREVTRNGKKVKESIVGPEQVVPNPLSTYLKLEGDNDGDHIFFISARGDMGKVYGNAIIGEDPSNDLTQWLKTNTYKNDFIVADQVDKATKSAERISLVDSRAIALEAKQSIGFVSATIRTIGTIKQMMEQYLSLQGSEKEAYGKTELSFMDSETGVAGYKTVSDIYEKYGAMNLGRDYDAFAASQLQLTLDFGNSGATEFNKNWYEKLMARTGLEVDIPSEYKYFISELSKGYKSLKFTSFDIKILGEALQGKKSPVHTDVLEKFRHVTGTKRGLIETLAKQYGGFLSEMDKQYELKFLVEDIKTGTDNDFLNRIKTLIKESPAYKESRMYGVDKKELIKKVSTILEESEGALRSYKNFIDRAFNEKNVTKAKIYETRAELFKMDLFKLLNKEERNAAGIYAHLLGEQKIVNFIQGKEIWDYFIGSDKDLLSRGSKAGVDINIPEVYTYDEYQKQELRGVIEELEAKLITETDEANIDLIKYEKARAEEKANIETFADKVREGKIETTIEKSDEESLEGSEAIIYNLPEISYESIDRSPQAINEMMSVNKDYVSLAKDGLKLTIQSLFGKYAPAFYAVYDTVQGLMNDGTLIREANKFHVYEMGDRWLGEKNSIYHQLKNSGLTTGNTEDLVRKIEKALLGNEGGKFGVADINEAIEIIRSDAKNYPEALSLIDQESFKERLKQYQNKVIGPVSVSLNYLQDYYEIDLLKKYGNGNFSIVTDALEAHKGNAQLALKIYGINDKQSFINMLRSNSDQLSGNIGEGTIRIMTKVIFSNTQSTMDKVLNFIQSVHYNMTYGTMATFFTQNNIIAGLSQIIPNYVELRANMLKNKDTLGEAYNILKEHRLLNSEDVIYFGTGHGISLGENFIDEFIGKVTKYIGEGITGKIPGVSKAKAERAGELLDSFVNNMLGFNDYPLEQMRKLGAVQTAMQKLGYANKKQLDQAIEEGGRVVRDGFESLVRKEFTNSGGGVVSSSSMRGTVFDHANEYFDNFLTQFITKSFGYLMGWSYHKMANLLEKESALFTGLKLLAKGDTGGFKVHIDDFFRYNTMVAQQIAITAGIFMKFQKYERDNNDRMPFGEFEKSFNNAFVSMQILFGKSMNAWNAAGEMGATGTEQTQYTLYTIVDKMFRLFRQPAFIATAYERYRSDEILGNANMFDAFQYAMKQHYTTYMRFQGMEAMNDYYNTIASKGNIGILGTGGTTLEDEMYNDIWVNKDFASWKEKGSLTKFLASFSGMMKTDESPLGFNVSIDLAKQMRERVMKDEYLSRLVNGGQLGSGKYDYDMARLIGATGTELTDAQMLSMDKIWTQLSYGAYVYLDEKGNRIKRDGAEIDESKIQDILEGQITKALAKKGITMEELIKLDPKTSPKLLKTMAVLDLENNLKTPLVLYTILSLKAEAIRKAMSKTEGQQGMTRYKELSNEKFAGIKRDLMLQYQEYFNLDNGIVENVIEQDIRTHHKDFLAKFDKISNFKNVSNDMFNLIKADHLVSNIMKTEKDVTSVPKLQTRYALAMRGLNVSTDTGVEVALKFMNDVNNLPYMDQKSKLAHQAAILYGLNKTQYNILKDNKRFQELTVDSQKQLTNWMYKVSSDSLDYDSKSMLSQINQAAGSRQSTKNFSTKYKSKAMSGQRPNFAQQFDPVRSYLPGKQQFISQNPNEFLKAAEDFRPQSFGINQARFPIMQDYARLIIENTFYGYKSKGIVPSYIVEPKVDLKTKKYINLKKPKKAAGKQSSGGSYKPAKKVSGGAWAGMPLSNIQK